MKKKTNEIEKKEKHRNGEDEEKHNTLFFFLFSWVYFLKKNLKKIFFVG